MTSTREGHILIKKSAKKKSSASASTKSREIKPKNESHTISTIVNAYIDICATLGLEHVTLKALAERTGLSHSNVKYHIDQSQLSLELLLSKFLRESIDLYIEENTYKDRATDGFDPLLSYSKHMLTWAQDKPHLATCLLMGYYKSALNHKNNSPSTFENGLTKALNRIDSLLNEGIGMGCYRSNLKDKREFVVSFHAMVLGNFLIAANLRSRKEFELRMQTLNSYVRKNLY